MSANINPERNHYFDNAKFILITLVVFGHSFEGLAGVGSVYKFIYLFHMPTFILIMGYFSKTTNFRRVAHSIFIYIIFQTLYCLYVGGSIISVQFYSPIWLMWFSLATLLWQLSIPLWSRLPHYVIILFAVGIAIGYINSIGYFFSLSRAIVFLPFFALGYCLTKDNILKVKRIKPAYAIISILIIFLLIRLFIPVPVGLLYSSNSYQAINIEWYGGILRALLYLSTLITTMLFLSLIPTRELWCTKLGSRTLNIYLLHGFIIIYAKNIKLPQSVNSPIEYAIYFICYILLILLLASKPVDIIMKFLTNPFGIFCNNRQPKSL